MDKYTIVGGRPLNGEVKIEGAKNAVLPILSACILHKGVSVLKNCPDIEDVRVTLRIMESLGCKTVFEEGTITIDAADISSTSVPTELAGRLRSSILFMGALLGRCGEVTIAYPGGCVVQFPISLPESGGKNG